MRSEATWDAMQIVPIFIPFGLIGMNDEFELSSEFRYD